MSTSPDSFSVPSDFSLPAWLLWLALKMESMFSQINRLLFHCSDNDFERYCDLLESKRSKIHSLREVKNKIEKTNERHRYGGRQLNNFRLWFYLSRDVQENEKIDSQTSNKDTSALREVARSLNLQEICFVGSDISLERFEIIKDVWEPFQEWFRKKCLESPMDEQTKNDIQVRLIKSKVMQEDFSMEWRKWRNGFSKTLLAASDLNTYGTGIEPELTLSKRPLCASFLREAEPPNQPYDESSPNPESKKRKSVEIDAKTGSAQQHQYPKDGMPMQLPQRLAAAFKTTVNELCITLERVSVPTWKVESLIPLQEEPPLGITGGAGWCLVTTRRTSPNLFLPAQAIQDIVKTPIARETALDYLRQELLPHTELYLTRFSLVPLIFLPSGMVVLMTVDGMLGILKAIKTVRAELAREKEKMLAGGTMIFRV